MYRLKQYLWNCLFWKKKGRHCIISSSTTKFALALHWDRREECGMFIQGRSWPFGERRADQYSFQIFLFLETALSVYNKFADYREWFRTTLRGGEHHHSSIAWPSKGPPHSSAPCLSQLHPAVPLTDLLWPELQERHWSDKFLYKLLPQAAVCFHPKSMSR